MDFWKNFMWLSHGLSKSFFEDLFCKHDFQLPERKKGIGGQDEGRTDHRPEKCEEHQEDSF